ncbi:MAG: hypothetical protein HY518_02390 [Candidatus Aenigmarchaeota archaeon]|nr:hypothetical protein [Candidatus Aenigmarchaeota archaeon]
MKLIAMAFLLVVAGAPAVAAMPALDRPLVTPPNPWLGEGMRITANCTDDLGQPISRIYAIINGPNIITQPLDLANLGQEYAVDVDSSFIDRPGQYEASVFCQNSLQEQDNMLTPFTVSTLTNRISGITPGRAYVSEPVEIGFFVYKDGVSLTPGAALGAFDVKIAGQSVISQQPTKYDTNRGWIIKLNAPSSRGIYTAEVSAEFSGQKAKNTTTLDVKDPIEFDITSVDRTDITQGDKIAVSMQATDRGVPIQLTTAMVSLKVGPAQTAILDFSHSGSISTARITAPPLPPKYYDIAAQLSYNGFSKTVTRGVTYIIQVSGSLLDVDGNPASAEIRFVRSDGFQSVVNTDAKGDYSAAIPAGTYDVIVKHSQATMTLEDVDIDEFDDPIRFSYTPGDVVAGISSSGIFMTESTLDYDDAEIEMKYDEKRFLDENDIKVFRCANWNAAKKACNSDWEEADSDIDKIKNTATVRSSITGTFVVGEKRGMEVEFKLNSQYSVSDMIQIQGLAVDPDRNPVDMATVRLSVKGTQLSAFAVTDVEGYVELELPVPQDEGTYKVLLTGEKDPFLDFSQDIDIIVTKKRELDIGVPDTVRLDKGESGGEEFTIANVGQADLTSLRLSITGIPEGLYRLERLSIDSLPVGALETVSVQFSAPEGSKADTYAGTFVVEADGKKYEKLFALTIAEEATPEAQETAPADSGNAAASGIPTGSFVLAPVSADMAYALVAIPAIIAASLTLRRRKASKAQPRPEIASMLADIKKEIYSAGKQGTRRRKR